MRPSISKRRPKRKAFGSRAPKVSVLDVTDSDVDIDTLLRATAKDEIETKSKTVIGPEFASKNGVESGKTSLIGSETMNLEAQVPSGKQPVDNHAKDDNENTVRPAVSSQVRVDRQKPMAKNVASGGRRSSSDLANFEDPEATESESEDFTKISRPKLTAANDVVEVEEASTVSKSTKLTGEEGGIEDPEDQREAVDEEDASVVKSPIEKHYGFKSPQKRLVSSPLSTQATTVTPSPAKKPRILGPETPSQPGWSASIEKLRAYFNNLDESHDLTIEEDHDIRPV